MIEKLSKKIFDVISNKDDSNEQQEILLFGITRIIEDIPKYIGILGICLLLKICKYFLVVMLVTILYKTFTGGVHLHTNIGCFVGSLISVLLCIYIPQVITNYDKLILPFWGFTYIFSLYVIWVYVPADVPEIPVINKERRKRDKLMAFIILNVLFMFSYFIVKDSLYQNIIITTILSIDIMTTRTIYKIFKNSYGYETYVPDELLL